MSRTDGDGGCLYFVPPALACRDIATSELSTARIEALMFDVNSVTPYKGFTTTLPLAPSDINKDHNPFAN